MSIIAVAQTVNRTNEKPIIFVFCGTEERMRPQCVRVNVTSPVRVWPWHVYMVAHGWLKLSCINYVLNFTVKVVLWTTAMLRYLLTSVIISTFDLTYKFQIRLVPSKITPLLISRIHVYFSLFLSHIFSSHFLLFLLNVFYRYSEGCKALLRLLTLPIEYFFFWSVE